MDLQAFSHHSILQDACSFPCVQMVKKHTTAKERAMIPFISVCSLAEWLILHYTDFPSLSIRNL